MITEDTQEAEGKFKKERTYQSAHNYIITTNAEQAAQVDVDDRRFLVVDCDNQMAGRETAESRAYFAKINDPKFFTSINELPIALSFARHLYERHVENFTPSVDLPQTRGTQQQKLQGLNDLESIVLTWLERGFIHYHSAAPYADDSEKIFVHDVSAGLVGYPLYWQRDHVGGFPGSAQKFDLGLARILGDCVTTDRFGKNRARFRFFKPLHECRARMNAYLGFEHFTPEDLAPPDYSETQWVVENLDMGCCFRVNDTAARDHERLQQEMSAINANIRFIERTLRDKREEYTKYQSQGRDLEWQAELRNEIEDLETERRDLLAQRNRI